MTSNTKYEFTCQQCGSGALAHDQFCRRCGTRHATSFSESQTALLAPTRALEDTAPLLTAPLPVYHAVSAPLVRVLTGSLATQPLGRTPCRWAKALRAALISLPVWLMIVLLSPLDAYAAVRATVEQ
jgi:hypothetical protein